MQKKNTFYQNKYYFEIFIIIKSYQFKINILESL